MSDQTIKLVPKLRFPEFMDAEEWTVTTLSKLANRVTLRNKNTTVSRVFTNSAVDGVVDQRDYFDKDIANQNNLENYFIVDEGCYVYNPRISNTAPVGPISKNKIGKGVMSPLYTVFKFNSAENDFYEQFFKTDNWYSYLKNISNTGARHDRMSISNDAFLEMPLPYPSPKEQQKIADCLSSLDDLITAQNQKVEALKQHKKGLMQQLFPTEGKAVPKLRFPEFENDGGWELTTIGNIGSFYYGKSAPKWSLEENAPTPCVRYGELYTKFGAEITETYSKTNIDPSNLKFSKGGEILVPRVGEKPEDFGKCCCFLPLKNIAIGEMISVFETNQNALFYTYYFRNMYKEFSNVVEGQNVKNLYYNQLEPLPIYRPPNLKEQQQIADCLSSLDDFITAQSRKIEILKEHKNGLMQQLFPSLDERLL